jgi:hypothetical protein
MIDLYRPSIRAGGEPEDRRGAWSRRASRHADELVPCRRGKLAMRDCSTELADDGLITKRRKTTATAATYARLSMAAGSAWRPGGRGTASAALRPPLRCRSPVHPNGNVPFGGFARRRPHNGSD